MLVLATQTCPKSYPDWLRWNVRCCRWVQVSGMRLVTMQSQGAASGSECGRVALPFASQALGEVIFTLCIRTDKTAARTRPRYRGRILVGPSRPLGSWGIVGRVPYVWVDIHESGQ